MTDRNHTLGVLRSIHTDELELMLAWRNAPNTRKNMYTRHEISLSEHLAWWQRISQQASNQYFMFDYRGTASGIVGFTNIDVENRNAAWAFYTAPNAPLGTGSRMEFLALEYAFHTLELHKLYCEVLAHNQAVIKMHQKFGFQLEGIWREHHKIEQSFVDIYRLGMLATEWQMQRLIFEQKLLAQGTRG